MYTTRATPECQHQRRSLQSSCDADPSVPTVDDRAEWLDDALRTYATAPSTSLLNDIVAETSWIATNCARRFVRRGEPFDDLLQVARIGLVLAIRRYDPARGVPFGAFATPTIVGELRRHFRDRTWGVYVPRRAKDLRGPVASATELLTGLLNRDPSSDEIGERLAIPAVLVDEVRQASRASCTTTLDRVERQHGDGSDPIAVALDRLLLGGLLEQLPPRERHVLELRYFEELSQAEIAARIGVSQVHVGRLIARSLTTLRRRTTAPQEPERLSA